MRRIKITEELEALMGAINEKLNLGLARFDNIDLALSSGQKALDPKGNVLLDPEKEDDKKFISLLREAMSDEIDLYYKGTPCYSCAPNELVTDNLGANVKNKDNFTLSCLFTNANVRQGGRFIELLKGRNVITVMNWSNMSVQNPRFPVNVRYSFRTKGLPQDNLDLIDEIKTFIKTNDLRDYIFLISAGPLSNVLVHQLFKENQNNTYLNIGDYFDPILTGKTTKPYHNPKDLASHKVCVYDLVEDESEPI